MLQPKKQKHRKMQKGRSRRRTTETRGLTISYGEYGLQATSSSWVNSRQIESVRKTLAHAMKREGRVWIRIFPDKPVTKLPPEVTLGGGKGNIDSYVFPVKPGRILFEIGGVSEKIALEALRLAGHKLPVRTKIITLAT
ncbi:50S ribosomal protein L16 [Candidatus Jorgensenbacteria bacterium RIFCSPLOWO2_02_FULL_45_12]|uniref:Large ribosomal subunit protein uL16 n=2 Tax=Candidatus Joergenseniibacteriota TaxID=1752739 RepID=A0A1F6BQB4_9BACT|nr:MAG: 50S ribosomal protein L16 [Candidatus Jorgensenbacteria bacterium GW2011_GWA2_45_9]OGG38952.1 MAG: 50S ribosomal protein L16 [Candidatus Jorgensenbacteria bacterium RIFCSPHIGHO2_02_FULL_45_20]OGG42711.1 MAG: 50S ribosomal protein L16 [Candidatus Jorgensenbacteria bacterium RIFCSPLOWO2_02_FULL_45_12]